MTLQALKNSYTAKRLSKADYIKRMFKVHKILFEYSNFIDGTDISQIQIIDSKVIMVCRDGIGFYCSENDRRLATIDALNFSSYEEGELKMSLALMGANFTVFDVGANIGWYSLHFSKLVKDSTIYAFEPVKDTYQKLLKNLDLNNVKNIRPLNIGFSDTKKRGFIFFDNGESVSASLVNIKASRAAKKTGARLDTIDSFVKKNKIKVDFIKCDTEGSELLVLKGGINILNEQRPIIFCEMLRKWSEKFGYSPNEIITMLGALGYVCFTISKGKLKVFRKMTDSTVNTNFFFLNKYEHHDKIKRFSL